MIRRHGGACCVAAFLICVLAGRADELSADDKLRVVYSTQFSWTTDGLPLVPIGVAEHISRAVISVQTGAVRVLPDGQGGAEVGAGQRWTVEVQNGKPAELRYHVTVAEIAATARATPAKVDLVAELNRWRARGFAPRTFDVGTVFGARGQVVDGRRHLVTVAPMTSLDSAKRRAAELAERYGIATSVHSEVVRLPRGRVVATDERGTVVTNDGILWFAAGGPDATLTLAAPEPRAYAGQLYATLDNQGQLLVVNAVPEDRLLEGLLPAEIGAGAPSEALKAQAVAARNELLAKIGTRHFGDPYRLCNKTHCQVYAGAGTADAHVRAAVQATRGELLVHSDGTLVDAVYSADCGGRTEDNERIWGGDADPSLRGIVDDETGARLAAAIPSDDQVRAWLTQKSPVPYCDPSRLGGRTGPNHRWQRTIDLGTASTRAGLGPITDLVIEQRGPSGRIARLRIVGKTGQRMVTGELDVRRALGMLPSALFVLDVVRQGGALHSASATGGGYGHGLGLCQQGAVGRALAGQSYRQILQSYYQDATLKKLY